MSTEYTLKERIMADNKKGNETVTHLTRDEFDDIIAFLNFITFSANKATPSNLSHHIGGIKNAAEQIKKRLNHEAH